MQHNFAAEVETCDPHNINRELIIRMEEAVLGCWDMDFFKVYCENGNEAQTTLVRCDAHWWLLMGAGTGESCGLPDGALHDLMTLLYYDMRRMLFTLRLFNFIFPYDGWPGNIPCDIVLGKRDTIWSFHAWLAKYLIGFYGSSRGEENMIS